MLLKVQEILSLCTMNSTIFYVLLIKFLFARQSFSTAEIQNNLFKRYYTS